MKTPFAKATGLVLVLGMMLNISFAQNNPNTTSTSSSTSSKTTPTKQASMTHKEETKDQWMKHYNELKAKSDALTSKAKMETKNPELTAEVTKLNRMEGDFKAKLDNWDKISADKKEAYNSDLRATHKALNEQYEKTKHMWDKKAEKGAAPASESPKN